MPKAGAKGGMHKKVMGMPVWVWVGVLAGGLLLGVYMRRKSSTGGAAPADTSGDTSMGAGATPSDNGLGSSQADMQDFLNAQGDLLNQFGSSLQDLILSSQGGANFGDGGFTDSGGDSVGGDSTGTVTLGLGNSGDLDLSGLSPATLRAAWADYAAAQKKSGIITQTHTIPASHPGTTVRVAGGSWTQVSGASRAAVKKVKAIFVPARAGQRAHWAIPSGRWVSGPGYY